jgi:hypothetical protein
MTTKGNEHRSGGRLLVSVTPSGQDLLRASGIAEDRCPRRYCWWWRTLNFDWELTPREGCAFLEPPKPSGFRDAAVPCHRCVPTSTIDQYEPREPHLLQDGFAVFRWFPAVRKPCLTGEISWDMAIKDCTRIEGRYRVGDGDWSVFQITKGAVDEPKWTTPSHEWGIANQSQHPTAAHYGFLGATIC